VRPVQAIAVSGLVKRFGSTVALQDVELEVAPGEIVVLLGPNGAGKSTLLRILGTTVLPDAGRVVVAGHDVVAEPHAVRRSVGLLVGDERSWYWRLSGRQNLEFFAVLHGLSRSAAASRAERLLAEVGLTDTANRRLDRYSSGMRARLSLARALIAGPPVLLLDEPTYRLDPTGSVTLREMLTGLASTRQTAILFVTHDLHEAAEISMRTVGLVNGRVVFSRPGGTSAAELERALVAATT
jgi:ABC-2 type transport system ATP-binding protein